MSLRHFHVFGCTDTGLIRPVNEDHILVGRFVKNCGTIGLEFAADDDFMTAYGLIFAVADGIGGAKAGEVASKLALTTIERHFYGFEKQSDNPDAFQEAVLAAGKRANDTVMQVAASRLDYSGMGCTLTGVCLTPSGYLVFNSGDSRVYRFRSGFLKQLTDDDTYVNSAVKVGQMTYEEAEQSDLRHRITNSIGYPDFRLKICQGPELRDEDCLLICSDGLHDLVPIERMEVIIKQSPLDQTATRLVAEAKANGGHDNISVVLVYYKLVEEIIDVETIMLGQDLAPDGTEQPDESCNLADMPIAIEEEVNGYDYQI